MSNHAVVAAAILLMSSLTGTFTQKASAGDESPKQTAADSEKKTVADSAKTDEKAEHGGADPQIVRFLQGADPIRQGALDSDLEWLNTSGPIALKELRGKVVLLDFWTYCCINCIHVLPDLKLLEKKYEKELVVIGVHSAKFANEKLTENIRDAILRYEIKHPVINDNEMEIWQRFGVRGWPTLALIDPEGKFILKRSGEGNLKLFDYLIGEVVKYHRDKGTLDESPIVFDLEERRAAKTPLRFPGKVLANAKSNRLFISDSNHNRIVVTDLNGTLQATIGSGRIGNKDGSFEEATFDHPQGMELVGNTLYVADTENHSIRTVDFDTKTVSTLSGTGKQGHPPDRGGPLKTTDLNSPWDLCHIDGTLFIAMAGPHQIWSHQLGTDEIKVYAGNGSEDVVNGALSKSSFAQPSGLAIDGKGEFFYVADSEGSSIRKVPVQADGTVTTVAGTSELPRGQSLFAFGDTDATGDKARFQHPLGVAWYEDSVYVADAYNQKIRRIDLKTNAVETWLGTGKAGRSLDPVQLSEPAGLSVAGDTLYIADTNNHRVLAVNLKTKACVPVELSGVTPPKPPNSRRTPDFSLAVPVAEQTVKSGGEFSVKIDLNVPEGFKLNELAPLTSEIFLIEGDQVLAESALDGRKPAELVESSAVVRIPLSDVSGKAAMAIAVSYGFCDKESETICRLASAVWKFSLVTSAEAEIQEVKLVFPAARSLK